LENKRKPAQSKSNSVAKRNENSVATTKGLKRKTSFADRFFEQSKRFFAQFGSAVIAVAIVAYVFLQLVLNVGTLLDTENASYVNISDRAEVTAYLFRDEKIIPATEKGTNCYMVEDGTKVHLGQEIAMVYSNPNDVKIQQRIQEIDKRIAVLEKSSLSTGASTTNIVMLDKQISELTLSMLRQADKSEFDKILREKEELLILMNRRQAIMQSANYSKELNELKKEKISLNASLSGTSHAATSPESGYFYSSVDGYENFFTLDRLKKLNAENFDSLSSAVADQSVIDNSAGKLISSSTWYIAVSLDKRTAEHFVNGGIYPIVFQYSNNTEINMTVERRITRSDKDVTILIFSTKQLPSGFDFSRCQTVEIPCESYEGLRVSTNAIRVKDGVTGVYAVVGTKIVFKPTEIIYSYGSYTICAIPTDPAYPNRRDIAYASKTYLSLHDAVVVDGNDIYDGMRID